MNGTGSNAVPSSAAGNTNRLIQGTASKLTNGPLRLTGKPSISNNGQRPSAISHWARVRSATSARAPGEHRT